METDGASAWPVLQNVWPQLDWAQAQFNHGAFHHVAVLGRSAVARVSFGSDHAVQTETEGRNLEALGRIQLPFVVPTLISGPFIQPNWSGQLNSYVDGAHRSDLPWPLVRATVEPVLHGLWDCTPSAESGLRPARDWCGAGRWPQIVAEITAPLGATLSGAANRIVAEVQSAEASAPAVLVHGDFGLHNLLWKGDTFSGLIDLDNACLGDAAMDVAPLVGAFGAAAVADIVNAELLERARIHRASLSLQVASAAQLAGDSVLRDFALQNFRNRFRAGTLYDPRAARHD